MHYSGERVWVQRSEDVQNHGRSPHIVIVWDFEEMGLQATGDDIKLSFVGQRRYFPSIPLDMLHFR